MQWDSQQARREADAKKKRQYEEERQQYIAEQQRKESDEWTLEMQREKVRLKQMRAEVDQKAHDEVAAEKRQYEVRGQWVRRVGRAGLEEGGMLPRSLHTPPTPEAPAP